MLRPRILLLALPLLLAACQKKDPPFARIDAALAPLLPADTRLAVCVRLDRLKKTPFWEPYFAARRIDPLERFAARTGLDPLNNIWELVIVSNGARTLTFIRGKFGGQFGLEPKLDLPAGARMSHKGYYMLGTEDMAVLFFNTGAAVAGVARDLRRIIDDRDNPEAGPPAELFSLLERVPGGAHIWAVVRDGANPGAWIPEPGPLGNARRVFAGVASGALWVNFPSAIEFQANMDYVQESAAAEVQDAVKALLALAGRNAAAQIEASREGNRLNLRGSVPEAESRRWLGRMGSTWVRTD